MPASTSSYRYKDARPSNADGLSGDALIEKLALGIEAMATRYGELDGQFKVLTNDVAGLRRMNGLAPAGATRSAADFEALGTFTKHVVGQRLGLPDLAKVAAPWSIDVDERGGYLIPVQIAGTIDALMRPEGGLLARCVKHTTEPGRTYRVPYYSTAPVAGWQASENADLSELDVQIAALDREPRALGGYLDASWQLMNQSAFDVGQAIVGECINAARQAFEEALVQSEGGVSGPWDGMLHAAGNEQTALATVTSALVAKFCWESLEDAPALSADGVLALHPVVFEALAASDASTRYSAQLNYGPSGPRFNMFDVVRSPAVPTSSIIMFSPRHVHTIGSGYTLIVDDRSQSKSLTVRLTFAAWSAYGISLADGVSHADVTAIV